MEKRRILTLLGILIFLPITLESLGLNINYSTQQNKMEPFLYIQYIINSTIDIDNDTAFGPSGYNFPGSGIEGDPYIIAGMNITSNSADLIDISDTTKYFDIKDNLLDGINASYNGISLSNVINGQIENNTLRNNKNGVKLASSSDGNYIYNNTISNNSENGIQLVDSDNNVIDDNNIYGNGNNGGGGGGSSLNHKNCVFSIQQAGHGGNGLYADPSSHNNITNNKIHNNSVNGIYLYECSYSLIQNNEIYKNQLNGIVLNNSNYNTVDNNEIYDNGDFGGGGSLLLALKKVFSVQQAGHGGNGLYADPSSNNNITSNELRNNSIFGVRIGVGSNENLVKCNNFIDNGPGSSPQAQDNGTDNTFITNYWDDWISPDSEPDGFVDDPYIIDGSANNADEWPVTAEILTVCPTTTVPTDDGIPGLTINIIMVSFIVILLTKKLISKDRKRK